jgi:hypothetical protein
MAKVGHDHKGETVPRNFVAERVSLDSGKSAGLVPFSRERPAALGSVKCG